MQKELGAETHATGSMEPKDVEAADNEAYWKGYREKMLKVQDPLDFIWARPRGVWGPGAPQKSHVTNFSVLSYGNFEKDPRFQQTYDEFNGFKHREPRHVLVHRTED